MVQYNSFNKSMVIYSQHSYCRNVLMVLSVSLIWNRLLFVTYFNLFNTRSLESEIKTIVDQASYFLAVSIIAHTNDGDFSALDQSYQFLKQKQTYMKWNSNNWYTISLCLAIHYKQVLGKCDFLIDSTSSDKSLFKVKWLQSMIKKCWPGILRN